MPQHRAVHVSPIPVVGFLLLDRLAAVILERLQATHQAARHLRHEQWALSRHCGRNPRHLVHPLVVVGRREEAEDVVTLFLEPTVGTAPAFRHGQFNMLTSFGRGKK